MTEIVQQFNENTAPGTWRDDSFRAVADWWAAQLPASYEPDMYAIPKPEGESPTARPITGAMCDAFAAALVDELKKVPRYTTPFGGAFILVSTSNAPEPGSTGTRTPATPLEDALRTAGMHELVFGPSELRSYQHADGQIFTTQGRIVYDGTPAVPYIADENTDFSAAEWMRPDQRYLIVPLIEGQKFFTCRTGNGTTAYKEETAGKDMVLILRSQDTPGFMDITAEAALDLRRVPAIRFANTATKDDYVHGKVLRDGTLEKFGDTGHFRVLAAPVQVLKVTTPVSIGPAYRYTTLQPGDFLVRAHTEHGTHTTALPKSWIDKGMRIYHPCTPSGELIHDVTLDKPVTALKPLKLTGGKQPA